MSFGAIRTLLRWSEIVEGRCTLESRGIVQLASHPPPARWQASSRAVSLFVQQCLCAVRAGSGDVKYLRTRRDAHAEQRGTLDAISACCTIHFVQCLYSHQSILVTSGLVALCRISNLYVLIKRRGFDSPPPPPRISNLESAAYKARLPFVHLLYSRLMVDLRYHFADAMRNSDRSCYSLCLST